MKTLKGVIKDWVVNNNRVIGIVVYTTDDPREGGSICTSEIICMESIPGTAAVKVETKNSIYILI